MQRKYQISKVNSTYHPQVSYDGGGTWATISNTVGLSKEGAQQVIDNFEKKLGESATPYTPSNKEILFG